jgi:integrase
MRGQRSARGSIELQGPTWWLRRTVLITDPATGEVQARRSCERLGSRTELRTRAAARSAADEYLALLVPERVSPGRVLLAVQYLEQFLAVHVPLMRPTSQRKYRSVIRTCLVPACAGQRLLDLDTAFLRQLIASHSAKRARMTVASIRGILLQVLRQARRDGYAARIIDPRDVRLPKTAAERERRNIRPDELDRILDASVYPWRALWAVMGYGGLRIGEALGLPWRHVDFERRILTIRQAAVAGTIAPLKTRTSRADVPILAPLEPILRQYRDLWQSNPAGLLFATRRGKPFASDDVRRRQLQPLLAALGLPRAGCHAFRHGLPGRLAAAGVSPNVIRQVMRHANLAMTEAYLHTTAVDVLRSLDAAYLRAQEPAPQIAADLP